MKKYLLIFAVAVSAIAFNSCKPKNNPDNPDNPDKPSTPEVTFQIAVTDITATTAKVSVTPSSESAFYYFDIIAAEYISEYSSDSAMVQDYVDYYEEMVEEYNKETGSHYSFFDEFVSQGTDGLEYESLSPSTEYYAFAACLDTTDNHVYGKVTKVSFTTDEVQNVQFSLTATPTDTCVIFTPNNNSITFLQDYMDTDTLNAYIVANGFTNAEQYFQAYMEYVGQMLVYYGYTLDDMAISGPFYISYTDQYVTPGRPFTLMAQAYTGGVFNSNFVSVAFDIPAASGAPAVKKGQLNQQMKLKKAKKVQKADMKVIRK